MGKKKYKKTERIWTWQKILFYTQNKNTSSALQTLAKELSDFKRIVKAAEIQSHADGTDENNYSENTLGYNDKQNPANDEPWKVMKLRVRQFNFE